MERNKYRKIRKYRAPEKFGFFAPFCADFVTFFGIFGNALGDP
jgi:hypothetical protein